MNDVIYKKMAIHRYLFETKFGNEEILPLSISPYISELINQNLDSIIDELKKINADEKVENWIEWRVLTKDKREFLLIKKAFDHYSGENRLEFLKMIASPFDISDACLRELIGSS